MDPLELIATQLSYYFVCHRKLWLFSHQINMEHTSELVEIGRLIHENSYAREKKEISIGPVKIDFIGSDGIVREIKKSAKMEKAHEWQLKYYLFYLEGKGVQDIKGEIVYPKLKRKKEISLTDSDRSELETIIIEIKRLVSEESIPPVINKAICNQCSYYELCYV